MEITRDGEKLTVFANGRIDTNNSPMSVKTYMIFLRVPDLRAFVMWN